MRADFRFFTDTHQEVELQRDFSKPAEKVWAAIIHPARIAEWMGVEWLTDVAHPLKQGDPFAYRFANTGIATKGEVLVCQPPFLFEHSWHDDTIYRSVVRWRLEPTREGCRLTLTHVFALKDDAPRTAAGWGMLTGQLEAWLNGASFQPSRSWRQTRDALAAHFPPEASRDARMIMVEGQRALQFVRVLRRPIEKVWAALTTPEGIEGWLQAKAELELRVHGRLHLAFQMVDHQLTGEVLAIDPPHLFAFTWPEAVAGAQSEVRIELEALDLHSCRLILTHCLPRADDLAGFASGWHWHLDGVEQAADGGWTAWNEARWRVLKIMYDATLMID